ncbi:hypothetical protein RJT34_30725 [Clitoria ternatea]|uniref:Uncharacterized protein n=1 Tax=Clitoria ternatea TaxID=43366 RepID=A0AAN9I4B5_CLITE
MTPPIVSSNSKIENQHSSVSASANQTNNNFESMFLHQSPFGLEMRRILSVRRKNTYPICKQTTLVMDVVRDDAGNEEEHQAVVINDGDDEDDDDEEEEEDNDDNDDDDGDDIRD